MCSCIYISKPLLSNTLCEATLMFIYKSPLGPPFFPGSPCPLKGNTFPVSTPAGILTLIFLFFLTVPLPWQVVQGSSIIFPLPPHLSHVLVLTKLPSEIGRASCRERV